jgi:tRNA(fMet)-specific endonuclease VapC
MKPAVLDTDIVLDILHGRAARVQEHAQHYRALYGRYTITAVTVAELARGSVRQGGSQGWLDQVLAQVEVLPLDTVAARLAGQVYGELERVGQGIGWADCLVAGIALVHNRVLVTGNVRHFMRVVELGYPLEMENWREEG